MDYTERVSIEDLRHRLGKFDDLTDEETLRTFIHQARLARRGTDLERVDLQLDGMRLLAKKRRPTGFVVKDIFSNDGSSSTQMLDAIWIWVTHPSTWFKR